MIDIKDLKYNKIYKAIFRIDESIWFFRFEKLSYHEIYCITYISPNQNIIYDRAMSNIEHNTIFKCTQQEIQWFETCEKAGKFIFSEDIIINKLNFKWY